MSNFYRGKKVLITGGLGFIGSNLAARLVEEGCEIAVIDSLIPEYGGNLRNVAAIADKISINVSDVRDVHSLEYLLRGKDLLFNLAGQTSHMDSMTDPQTDLEINARAQLAMLEACRRHNPGIKIVFASTRQIYGRPDYLPVDEKHPLRPVDVNGINKMAGEFYHILYNDVYSLRAAVLRLTNTIGPRMRIKDARQTFLGVWVRLLLEEKQFEVWDGPQLRDFTYVDDAVDALMLAGESESANGQVYNVGGPPPVSLSELAAMLVEVNGGGFYETREYPVDRKRIDIGDYYADSLKLQTELAWSARTDLRSAVRKTLDYYRVELPHYV
jgi:UDP-glucose 4-epimerase